jgi:uracil-DNA glycosylase
VRPEIILVLGRFAAQSLLRTEASIASLRGKLHSYAVAGRDVPVVVTYHPAYLLRNPTDKAKTWADLCFLQSHLTKFSK